MLKLFTNTYQQWRISDLKEVFELSSFNECDYLWVPITKKNVDDFDIVLPGVSTPLLMAEHYRGRLLYAGDPGNAFDFVSRKDDVFVKVVDFKNGPLAKVRPAVSILAFNQNIAVYEPWDENPVSEWRVWWCDGGVLDSVPYMINGESFSELLGRGWSERVVEQLPVKSFVEDYVRSLSFDLPSHMSKAVIDVGVWGNDFECGLIEINCPYTSDWYDADLSRIAPALKLS